MALARCDAHPPGPGRKAHIHPVPAAGKGLVCEAEMMAESMTFPRRLSTRRTSTLHFSVCG